MNEALVIGRERPPASRLGASLNKFDRSATRCSACVAADGRSVRPKIVVDESLCPSALSKGPATAAGPDETGSPL
jgi:hypothetical protein